MLTVSSLNSKALRDAIEALVDHKVGIISRLIQAPLQLDEPDLNIFHATCSSPLYLNSNWTIYKSTAFRDIQATGCAFDRDEALWATLGEAVERYGSGRWGDFDLVSASQNDLGPVAVNLADFILYDDTQYADESFPFKRISERDNMRWVEGKKISDGSKVLIPAQLVCMDYQPVFPAEIIAPQISTGMAAGSTLEHALHTGLREVIERDSFAAHWLLKAQPPALIMSEAQKELLPPKLQALLADDRFDINLRWITSELDIPVVMVLLRSKYHEGTAIGCSCHPNALQAIEKAIVEAFHSWNWTLDMKRQGMPCSAAKSIVTFEDHVQHYITDENNHKLANFYSENRVDLSDDYICPAGGYEDQLSLMLDRTITSGFEPICYEFKVQDINAAGFYVTRVIIPGLQPLWSGYGLEPRDPRRLQVYAERLGLDLVINTDPHPFP